MNFFPLSQQNDMYPLPAKKFETSRSPFPVPISLGREKGGASVGPLEGGSTAPFPRKGTAIPGSLAEGPTQRGYGS